MNSIDALDMMIASSLMGAYRKGYEDALKDTENIINKLNRV
jgi:hypothetical protein